MAKSSSTLLYRMLHVPPRVLYRLGLGRLISGLVLLLTTRGRKTGQRRVTPLQYERVDGAILVASIRGTEADWYRNILAHPAVELKIGSHHLTGQATGITDVDDVTDFLELRLRRHPFMVGRILRFEGLPAHPTRADLAQYATGLALARIHPTDMSE